jgi:hypothetical protein
MAFSAMAINPRASPVESRESRLCLRVEGAEDVRGLHQFAVSRNCAAGKVRSAILDGMSPDGISLVVFGLHSSVGHVLRVS